MFPHSFTWDQALRPSGFPRCVDVGRMASNGSSSAALTGDPAGVPCPADSAQCHPDGGVEAEGGEGGISTSSVFLIPAFPRLLVLVKPFTPLRASSISVFGRDMHIQR